MIPSMANQQRNDIEVRLALIEQDNDVMKGVLSDIKQYMGEISASLQKLVVLETEHTHTRDGLQRAFAEIKAVQDQQTKIEERVSRIERSMPSLIMVKQWVVRGVLAVVGLVLVAAVGSVLVK
jgi:chromosome segregation ATPase